MSSYVYVETSEPGAPTVYTVGFYDPSGDWRAESDHVYKEGATQRVHYLNGGGGEIVVLKP